MDDTTGFETTGPGGSGAAGSGGYTDGDASIDVLGDAAPSVVKSDYASLCGLDESSTEIACVPGGAAERCAPGGDPGVGGAGGEAAQTLFCQLTFEADQPVPVCAEVGTAGFEDACNETLPCGPGLACVKAQDSASVGQCLWYCCGDVEECPLVSAGDESNTYCAPNPLLEQPEHVVPVCQPTVECQLLGSTCGAGEKCAVVRLDGTTSCVPEDGDGELCEPCPCAEGYACHQLSQTCQKICHTSTAYGDECQGGSCLGGSMSFPDGFGVCVGGEAACQ
jgi:hypothetical protein